MAENPLSVGERRLSVDEERLLRMFAQFKLELFHELEQRFKDVATTSSVTALADHYKELDRRVQRLERSVDVRSRLLTMLRWVVPILLGVAIAFGPHLRLG